MSIFGIKIVAFAALVAALAQGVTAQTKLLRFPDIYGEKVAFGYAGDIWTAPVSGGTAVRVTAHPGLELFPRFSPDGKWIAFTGQYDGDEQVYIVPIEGGVPKQLTFYPARGPLTPRNGYDNQVYGWTPDGKEVLFRSMMDADNGRSRTALYTVSLDGGLPTSLPMPYAGAGDFSPDGKKLVYSPLFRDFRTWKRYQGGWAQDLFIFDIASHQTKSFASSPRTERDPMWIRNSIYFVSDRDGTLNLYSYDTTNEKVAKLTDSTTWDVRWASSDNSSRVVYEFGGELRVFDVAAKQDKKISILVPNDGVAMRPSHYPVEKFIESAGLSPKGERALFVARGDVFTAPIEKGPTRNLTNSSAAHDRGAVWSPNGSKIAFISDLSGEDQLYLVNQDGSGKPEPLTTQFAAMLNPPEWSPDGKYLAFTNKNGKLFVLTLEDKKVIEVADDRYGGIGDFAWSPCSGHIAFSMGNANGFRSLYIWSVADGTQKRVTDDVFTSNNPAWDPEGKHLYFLSRREFAPQISSVEFNYAGNRMIGIFALALRKDLPNPFPPESDEVTIGDKKDGEKKDAPAEKTEKTDDSKAEKSGDGAVKKDPAEKKEKALTKIDFDGLGERLSRVPIDAENISGLVITKGNIIFVTSGAPFNGRDSYEKSKLHIYDAKKREDSVIAEDVNDVALSADGAKVLVREGQRWAVYDAKPKAKDKKTVATNGLAVDRVPQEEWTAIFNEVWRRYRDFFYVRNMHGYDWKKLGDQYRALLPYVAHRSDLTYVLGEMVAELSVGHAYIEGGDYEIPERPRVGLPGARFVLDEKAGRYQIARIFRGHNAERKYRSPLTEVGVNITVGDYILAIDDDELKATDNPYRLLRYKTDPITLTVNSKPTLEGARKVKYNPIFDESGLLYLNWVLDNVDKVNKLTDGRVGYIHIPDMGAPGAYEFIKWFYPQIRKEGLIVDVRANGGGSISQWIIERLNRKLLGTRFGFASDEPSTYPGAVLHGAKVCLINETSASDGDIFPHMFRKAGLGPLIGKRTWGGVVGISGRGPLIDGGQAFVPLSGTNDVDGSWVIEGHGVDPDIVVENEPQSVIDGKDPQLERGVHEVLRVMAANPLKLPKRPADPVKTK